MAYNHASHMASGMMNGGARNGNRNANAPEYRHDGSVVGYIPDDVSSIHSSAMGGVGVPPGYPPMFQGFTPDNWPGMHNQTGARRGQNGISKGKGNMPPSITGESTVATESDITASTAGGVGLENLSITGPNKATSYNQSDRLKRYVEGAPPDRPGFARGKAAATQDEDARSVSTALASQVGGGYD